MIEWSNMLSYLLFLFILYIYLPYTFFKFCTERWIDLGMRRDATQLEEIVSAFLPSSVLHVMAAALYLILQRVHLVHYDLDLGTLAAIAGDNRNVIANWVYAGGWQGFFIYLAILWGMAILNGWWFGRATLAACKNNVAALEGIEELWRETSSKPLFKRLLAVLASPVVPPRHRLIWLIWYRFFHESIVPLFPWQAAQPTVFVTMRDGRIYKGLFIRYEKTTDGTLDAVRLNHAKRYQWNAEKQKLGELTWELGAVYLNWSEVSDISVFAADSPGTRVPPSAVPASGAKLTIRHRTDTRIEAIHLT